MAKRERIATRLYQLAFDSRFFLTVLRSSLLVGMIVVAAAQTDSFTPNISVYINCGSSSNTTAPGLPVYLADDSPDYISEGFLGSNGTSSSNEYPYNGLLDDARVFFNTSTYKIDGVSPGRVWIRLWFYPSAFVYSNQQKYEPSSARFSVVANEFTLLTNLTATTIGSEIGSGDKGYFYVEYLISVPESRTSVSITFKPEPDATAFVNALGVESAPDNLIRDSVYFVPTEKTTFPMENSAMQTMVRANVGGQDVTPESDSMLGRQWKSLTYESRFLFGAVQGTPVNPNVSISYSTGVSKWIAPASVYDTALTLGQDPTTNRLVNLTFSFPIDPGFWYLVRLHFAEIVYEDQNQRVFNVYLNNQTAYYLYEAVVAGGGKPNCASFLDYVLSMSDGKHDKIWLALGTPLKGASQTQYYDVLLNGLEIFKLNNTNSSLAGTAVSVATTNTRGGGKKGGLKSGIIVGVVCGSVVLGSLFVAVCFFRCFRSKGNHHARRSSSAWVPSSFTGSTSGRQKIFTFSELQRATNKFDENLLLGVGGFGKVYKARIDENTLVAVKRANPESRVNPGLEYVVTQFETEVELLSKLRHRHLVSLIGYCKENSEMLLVYDYMANGPLRGHLYGTDLPPLSWQQRLEICIGAARGLHYLHTGAGEGIIHRDVKSTNILLDENFVAKVADFGLSKTAPPVDKTHISTQVKGSFGYLDPEYYRRQKLTEKSDIYSFGVVLMEVLCALPAVHPEFYGEHLTIVEWAMQWQRSGMLEQIVDPRLVGYVNPDSLKKFGETAEKCLAEQGRERPAMSDVLWNLEYALQLQQNSVETSWVDAHESSERILHLPLRTFEIHNPSLPMPIHGSRLPGSEEPEEASAMAVFSQLLNLQGR